MSNTYDDKYRHTDFILGIGRNKFEGMIRSEIDKCIKEYIILIPTLDGNYHETILLELNVHKRWCELN